MAYLFNNVAWKLTLGSALVTATPLTVLLDVRMRDHADGVDTALFGISKGSGGGFNEAFLLGLNTAAKVYATTVHNSAFNASIHPTAIADERTHQIAAVFTSPTSWVSYLDAVMGTPATTSTTPTGLTVSAIGGFQPSSGSFAGSTGREVSKVTVWNVALTGAQLLSIYNGSVDRTSIAPSNIKANLALAVDATDTIGNSWTVSGATLLTPPWLFTKPRHGGIQALGR